MVQSVRRAVRILHELARGGPRLGVTELAERLGVAKPTVHALLRTLASENLVSQDRDTGKYQLGPALVSLGNAYLGTHELRTHSVAWADALATRVAESVWVAVLTGDRVLVVHHSLPPGESLQASEVGASVPWNTCALGKAIVAFSPPADRRRLTTGELTVLTGASITDPHALAEQMEQVRRTGFALEDQEAALGDAGIAAPVFDRSGDVVGAIGVVGAVERLSGEGPRRDVAVSVRETARNLSRDLGASRHPARRT